MVVSVFLLFLHFFPVLKEEAKYQLLPSQEGKKVMTETERQDRKLDSSQVLIPVSEEFGIVIPKIGANAVVIPDVDWRNPSEYQQALTLGVAQAKGTASPGDFGNVFFFAHSGIDAFQANRYNALFYLIDKLQQGDEIVVFYQKKRIAYHVIEKKRVKPEQVEYLSGNRNSRTLTLMTCYPAGTTLERLLVIAAQNENY